MLNKIKAIYKTFLFKNRWCTKLNCDNATKWLEHEQNWKCKVKTDFMLVAPHWLTNNGFIILNISALFCVYSCCRCHKNELWTEQSGPFTLCDTQHDRLQTWWLGSHSSRRHVLRSRSGWSSAQVAPDMHNHTWNTGAYWWPGTGSIWKPWHQKIIT